MVRLALAAFLLRALVPAGLMAAPVAEGWLFQLCPSGMAMSSYMVLLGQEPGLNTPGHEHGVSHSNSHTNFSDAETDSGTHAQHAQLDADPVCGLSVSFYALHLEADAQLSEPAYSEAVLNHRPAILFARGPPRANSTRAPPKTS